MPTALWSAAGGRVTPHTLGLTTSGWSHRDDQHRRDSLSQTTGQGGGCQRCLVAERGKDKQQTRAPSELSGKHKVSPEGREVSDGGSALQISPGGGGTGEINITCDQR